jgi:hypothetical protein
MASLCLKERPRNSGCLAILIVARSLFNPYNCSPFIDDIVIPPVPQAVIPLILMLKVLLLPEP